MSTRYDENGVMIQTNVTLKYEPLRAALEIREAEGTSIAEIVRRGIALYHADFMDRQETGIVHLPVGRQPHTREGGLNREREVG